MNKMFFIKNRASIYSMLKNNSIIILFSGKAPHKSNDAYYNFEVNKNFYYLTGIQKENITFMAINFEGKVEEFLFVEKPDPILAKWVGESISVDEATEISGIEMILYQNDFKSKLVRCLSSSNKPITYVYFDLSKYAWDDPDTMPIAFSREIINKYPQLDIADISKEFVKLRSIKSTEEVARIIKAINITNEGIENLMKNSKPGMRECELEAYFDFTLKSKGVQHAFQTIAASGINGTILHYIDNKRVLKEHDLILFDLGASVDNYCSDISRTFPVNGKFTNRQKEVYNVVLSCMKEVINHMQPGASMTAINKLARNLLAQGCISIGLIKSLEEIDNYYYHSIGHSLGLDTHDIGDRDVILQPGMVYTCEPGLYIQEESIGIRIEDDILITEEGNINLSNHIIKEVDAIESFMSSISN
ncbi:M24 family metallopeptidase [Alkalibaculum sp. M08DMB]|uniref:Xaa-Pro aminopeptidase n=1 Tax=Alkalibaculum sporogenes TaxID=2655001 RepID=A0A6A7K852_9FIRM|nr:aminopeptidase P family protein [Alkalibaculum sporogenes]MPW25397.1 M24 family metallopeptidase [Alkalibaculum sporogenes]